MKDMNRNLSKKTKVLALSVIQLLTLSTLSPIMAQQPTRGIGIYPGAPEESFEPQLVNSTEYRNVARGRMVYQSSSFDFNMTAQLLTDGIVSSRPSRINTSEAPVFLEVTTPDGQLPQRQRESTIDGNEWTQTIVMGSDTWLQYAWHGMSINADAIHLIGTVAYRENEANEGYRIRVMASQDGKRWQQMAIDESSGLLGKTAYGMVHSDPNKNSDSDDMLPTRRVDMQLPFSEASTFNYLRIELKMKGAAYWTFTENPITLKGKRVENLLPSLGFTSAWMVLSDHDEWACVDLGAKADISKINLHWIEKPKRFELQLSDDGKHFTKFNIKHPTGNQQARYVRVYIPSAGKVQRVILSEIEVMGRGGLVAKAKAEGGWQDGKYLLDGGDWRVQRASEVTATGSQISAEDFDASAWTVATVPATVLMSHVNAGALPNPNYDDNLLLSSESFFNSNFWYRRTFRVPAEMQGQHVFLNFDGINWKADIWLNGQKVNRIEGAFMRGKTDISSYLRDGVNVLAVEIERCAHPGGAKLKNEQTTDFNGGRLGADNPTFHATVGWDWISSIRGRDIGIWDDVYLTAALSGITLSDPIVSSTVKIDGADTLATMMPAVMVTNHSDQSLTAKLKGWIGTIKFEKDITLEAHATKEVCFNPADFSQLCDQKMRLWWPNGYGEPYLYDAGFELYASTPQLLHSLNYKTGIREITYDEVDTRLQVYVNNQRFVPLGGNWGFSENNLCYRGREYDAAVRYHRDMNLNCIRNWVGQVGDREFYEACDRHGIMVWQDFWLANPADGPDPDDNEMFLRNARDMVQRVRQHPCIMLYCGRNEGYPPKALDDGLRQLVSELTTPLPSGRNGGGALYISSSADDGVSGHGPYRAIPAKEYFARQTGKLHSERGMPNIMTYEGLARTLRPEHLWPQNEYWGQHDFTQQGAQRGTSFNQLIACAFGEPKDAREFTTLAQWQNYDGYRAMYESTNHDRQGLLIWMSHPAWPSMVWQTYDYYLEPTAAYFGTKKACEPLHVQWNALTDSIEIVNRTANDYRQLAVEAQLLNAEGRQMACEHGVADINPDHTTTVLKPAFLNQLGQHLGIHGAGFLRLRLTNADQETLSENTYVCAADTGNYQALKAVGNATLKIKASLNKDVVSSHRYIVTLENTSTVPAMMIRLNLVGDDGEQVLPVLYEDNYFHLMPGEQRTIDVEWNPRDARNQQPHLEISGFNVPVCQ